MIIEVKQAVAANFQQINLHHTLEFLIYCNYLMKLNNLGKIMGMITDGHTWHTITIIYKNGGFMLQTITDFPASKFWAPYHNRLIN